MNVDSSKKLRLILICSLTIALVLLSSQYLFAYEHEIRVLSTSIADHIAEAGKKRIAVVDFTDLQGNITELGRFLAEELSVDLTNTAKGFEVIDRNHLNRILAEHKLSLSGIVDQKTVQKLGQIAGVDALITGSITPLERSVRVVCKVIATDTARVISAAKGDIAKTKAIEELFGKGIETGTSGQTSTSSKPQPKAISRADMKGFTFEAKGCKLKPDKTVVCHVTVINNDEREREIAIYADGQWTTFLYDNLGNQYNAKRIKVGKEERQGSIELAFPSNMPTNIFLVFEDVSQQAQSVSLRLACYHKGEFFPVLRNIPLSR